MAVFEITSPDGKTYRIEGATREGALSALQAHLGEATPAPTRIMANQRQDGESVEDYRNRLLSSPVPTPQGSQDMTDMSLDAIRQSQGIMHRIGDNVIGFDDGFNSPGEKLGTLTGMAIESGTFGLVGDEMNAAANAALGGDYDANLARFRGNEGQMREDHPALSLGADIAGGIAGPGAAIGGAAKLGGGLLAQMLSGAAAGAAGGGTHSFMEGEGGFSNRANEVPMGAALGTLGGSLAPVAGKIAGGLWGAFGPGMSAASRVAQRRLGLDRTGGELVASAVERDAPSIQRNLGLAGPNAVNAQTGANTQGLLDWVINRPGAASAQTGVKLQAIAKAAEDDVGRVIDNTLGTANGAERTRRAAMTQTAATRRKVYDAAYASPIDYSANAGRELESLLTRVPEDVLRKAEKLMRTQGEESSQILGRLADDGTVSFEALPDVRQIDYITRALRDSGDFGVGEGKEQGRAFMALAREIRQTVDDLVPEYKAARSSGRDAILNREAVKPW